MVCNNTVALCEEEHLLRDCFQTLALLPAGVQIHAG